MGERIAVWTMHALGWVREKVQTHEEGQAAVEYGVLLALILALAIVFIKPVGTKVVDAFSTISASL
jgi:Flp pilus assembly pilin Flp